jgi:hypothetical protein
VFQTHVIGWRFRSQQIDGSVESVISASKCQPTTARFAPRSATVRPLMTSIPDTSKGPPPCFRRPRKIQEDSEKTPFEDPEER